MRVWDVLLQLRRLKQRALQLQGLRPQLGQVGALEGVMRPIKKSRKLLEAGRAPVSTSIAAAPSTQPASKQQALDQVSIPWPVPLAAVIAFASCSRTRYCYLLVQDSDVLIILSASSCMHP